jgi:hypothetical protein
MTSTGYTLVAENFITMATEQPGGFDVLLCHRLIWRSKELPTAATSDQLFTDVLSEWVKKEWDAFDAYRRRVRNAPAWSILVSSIPSIVEALKPLCVRVFPTLNVALSVDRDALFHPQNYIKTAGRLYYEEAPSFTFTRFLNDMERYRTVKPETYEREVSRISEVHALNRVANIMPGTFHRGFDGMLQPGETVEQMVQRERARVWRNALGDMTMDDILAEAGMA